MKKTEPQTQKKILIILFTILLLIDQISKFIAYKFPDFEIKNEQISDNNGYYIIMSIIVVLMIIRYISNDNTFIKLDTKIILSFGIAGAIGNTIDRIIRKSVVNFIPIGNSLKLNLAYIYILVAWIGMATILTKNTMKIIREKNKNKL